MLNGMFVTKSYAKGKKMAMNKKKTATKWSMSSMANKMGSEGPKKYVGSDKVFKLQKKGTVMPAAEKRARELAAAQRKAKAAGARMKMGAEGPKGKNRPKTTGPAKGSVASSYMSGGRGRNPIVGVKYSKPKPKASKMKYGKR